MKSAANILPKEQWIKEVMDTKKSVQDVSEYICRVKKYIECRRQRIGARRMEEITCVYRGEAENYPTPCMPKLFRENTLGEVPCFEQNLIYTLRQKTVSGNLAKDREPLLYTAMEVQHCEMTSRLLDVTYNCLAALYFAVTPYYHSDPSALDKVDGVVYLFFVDQIYSPCAPNIQEQYEASIKKDHAWYEDKEIFKRNHKFIDHLDQNHRIIAQQGAFLLFPGSEPEPIPDAMFCSILIPAEAKARMRQELDQLFGINTGSIYPEITNQTAKFMEHSKKICQTPFTCENELRLALRNLKRGLEYYLDYILDYKEDAANLPNIFTVVERMVHSYKRGLLELDPDNCPDVRDVLPPKIWREMAEEYNGLLNTFNRELREEGVPDFDEEALMISKGELKGGCTV